MLKHLPYLSTILIFVIFPSIILWGLYYRYLKNYLKVFVIITICSIIWGFLFDIIGVNWGIWFYNKTLGISYLGLPLEEYLLLFLLPQQITAMLLLIRKKIYG